MAKCDVVVGYDFESRFYAVLVCTSKDGAGDTALGVTWRTQGERLAVLDALVRAGLPLHPHV